SGDGSGHERCQKYLAQIFDRGSGFGLTLGLEPIWDMICIVKTNFIYSYWIQFQGYMVKALTHILKLLSSNRKCWFNSFLNSLIDTMSIWGFWDKTHNIVISVLGPLEA